MSDPTAELAATASPQSVTGISLTADAASSSVVDIGQWTPLTGSAPENKSTRAHCENSDLLGKLLSASTRGHAAAILADEIQARGNFSRVAVGLCRSPGKPCRLVAISGSPDFDRRTELARQYEAVLDEAVLRKTAAVWASDNDSRPRATASQKTLCLACEANYLVSVPLVDFDGRAAGAIVCLGTDSAQETATRLADSGVLPPHIAACLKLLPHRTRAVAMVAKLLGSWRGGKGAAVILGTLVVASVLAFPLPYKVSCKCSMQPVMRRFVAAPFAARLEAVMAEPGDLVSKGQGLARLDGREIRWELAGLTADLDRAAKARDAGLSGQDAAAAQLASLEMQRIRQKIDLLADRAAHLDIRSPIEGLVIAGDLKKTEGAPVPTGQPLFEVAPLDRMRAELYIPDDEISHVASGQRAAFRLDAHPKLLVEGTLSRIHPRAEIHDAENVFVAEVLLDNRSDVLRPGMNGRAKIVTRRHSLAWNLFHKAFDRILGSLGW